MTQSEREVCFVGGVGLIPTPLARVWDAAAQDRIVRVALLGAAVQRVPVDLEQRRVEQ
jgi:hypothetical protein